MRRRTDGSLILIDYEYAGYGDRGFDIGNHFCEWSSDYHSDLPHSHNADAYPTRAEQEIFVRAYLAECAKISQARSAPHSPPLSPTSVNDDAESVASNSEDDEEAREEAAISEDNVEELLHEANVFALASHLHWALWGVVQGMTSQIDFDFFGYAAGRFNRYLEIKDEVLDSWEPTVASPSSSSNDEDGDSHEN